MRGENESAKDGGCLSAIFKCRRKSGREGARAVFPLSLRFCLVVYRPRRLPCCVPPSPPAGTPEPPPCPRRPSAAPEERCASSAAAWRRSTGRRWTRSAAQVQRTTFQAGCDCKFKVRFGDDVVFLPVNENYVSGGECVKGEDDTHARAHTHLCDGSEVGCRF